MSALLTSSSAQRESTDAVVTAELILTVMTGLAKNAGVGILGAFLLASLPSVLSWHGVWPVAATAWFVAVTILMFVGMRAGRSVTRQALDAKGLLQLENILVIRAAVASVIWGSASWVLLPAGSIEGETFVVMGISMILMGGAGGHAAHRQTLFAFAAPFAVLFAAGLIRLGDAMHVILGIGFLIFAIVTILFAMNQGEAVRKQLLATLESESLRLVAESASRAKTDFLAAASHDLRQPLHALSMFLGTLTFHVTTDDGKRLLDRTKETVRVLEEQFNSLLDLSRFDAGAVVAEIRPFKLDSVVERIVDQLRPLAEAKQLPLLLQISPAIAKSDPILLARLLRNLLDNAVKYTVTGSVTVRVSERPQGYLVEVIDTGPGIPADQHARIFDEYVQLANPARQRRHGVGLGLAIAKRIDGLLGLNLNLSSAVGEGSQFSLLVPAAAPGDVDAHLAKHILDPASHPATFKTSAQVWILDDDPMALESLQGQLAAWGASVTNFSHAEDLLEKVRSGTPLPQWVLTDDMLGESSSGLKTAQMLSQHFGFGNVCIITGNTEPTRLAELRASGFPVIVKPATPQQVIAVIGG